MKNIFLLVIGATLIMTVGCAGHPINLVETGVVTVETGESNRAEVAGVRVRQVGFQTIVDGAIVRSEHTRILKGFVRVDVIDSRGVRVDSNDTRFTFRKSGIREAKTALFSARFSSPIAAGSKIVVQPNDTLEGYQEDTGVLTLQ